MVLRVPDAAPNLSGIPAWPEPLEGPPETSQPGSRERGWDTEPALAGESQVEGADAASGSPRTLRSILVAAAAHELRSTLSLVSGYSQSLQYLALDAPTRRQYLERIISAATALAECADELVELADDERPPLRREPMAIAWLVERANRELTTGESHTLERSIPPGLPLVEVDPAWVLHVLRNLVTNARRHGAGEGAVAIHAQLRGEFVVVSVVDRGRGIDPEDRPHVFEPFYRGAHARSAGVPGSGIGLYVCRRLIEAQGGEIWLDETTAGTSISFSLPVWHAPVGVRSEPVRSADGPSGKG
ncbi:MAG: sensor histidine kinase [Candidatus Limnocylindrales bacterium]